MAKRKPRKRVPASDRSKILAEMAAGGLTAKKIAKKYGVSPWTVYGWRQRAGVTRNRGSKVRGRATSQPTASISAAATRRIIQDLLPGLVRAEITRIVGGLVQQRVKRAGRRSRAAR